MTPNKEHIRLWVEALRSGKYNQARDALRIQDHFCVLGVACDVSGLGEWVDDPTSEVGYKRYVVGHEDVIESLPDAVSKWLGMKQHVLLRDTSGRPVNLAMLNDVQRYNLPQLADVIESHFLKGDNDAPSGD